MMKQHAFFLMKHILFICSLMCHVISYGEIVEGTMILTLQGLIPVQQISMGDYVIGYYNNAFVKSEVTHISCAETDVVFSIETDEGIIFITADQRFYDPCINQWIRATNLKAGNVFINSNLHHCVCKSVTLYQKKSLVYKISTKSPHNFFISDRCVLTHNNPFFIALTWAFGGGVEFLGMTLGAAFGGTVIGAKLYNKYKRNNISPFDRKSEISLNSGGCFSDTDNNHAKMAEGCFTYEPGVAHITSCYPVQEAANESGVGCTIIVESHKNKTVGCVPIRQEINSSGERFEGVKKDVVSDEKRYNGPWYNRTEEWIKQHPFGQKIEKLLKRSRYTNQGKRAVQMIDKLKDCDWIKKDDYVVVDALHNDHLEVFGKNTQWSHVINFDGTINYEKTRQAQKDKRQPLKKGLK